MVSSDLVDQLGELLDSGEGEEEEYAKVKGAELNLRPSSQLWWFTTVLLHSASPSNKDDGPQLKLRVRLQKYATLDDKPSENNTHLLERAQKHLAAQLSQVLASYTPPSYDDHTAYFRRILFCMLSAEICPESDPRWELVGGFKSDNTSKDFGHLSLPSAKHDLLPEFSGVAGATGEGPSTPKSMQDLD